MRWKRSTGCALGCAGLLLMAIDSSAVAQGARDTHYDGGALFKTYCASCHGTSGRGDGPVAEHLKIPPANLTQIAKRNGGTFPADQVFEIIDGRQVVKAHGDSQMPVWGDAFSRTADADEDSVKRRIEALVAYLEKIQERQAGPEALVP
jgi:mono/diheme cytochrome c family protein